MTAAVLRTATAGLLTAAAVVGMAGCATHRHWMTAQPATVSATSHPTANQMAPFPAPSASATPPTASASVAAPASASPSPNPSSAPAPQAATQQREQDTRVAAPHRHRRHHTESTRPAGTAPHPAGARPAGRHGTSPCDALAHEGGLPGNLYAQCRQLYG
ncbi:hypothetical protein ABH931_007417 [Streptacidiphilus sp. MAP12-33]|uniref:hypothetical protein n=1 Tax=Streptacidiphilus sp. MAP12-33 TaxID=3156266 RepID=UPI003517B6C9